ncbi:hypothetical protein ACLKA6_007965 [Drosophila palustris]
MTSKLWSEVQEVTDIAGYLTAFLPNMRLTMERLKFELKTMLELGQQMTQKIRKSIANYRAQREREKAKRSNKLANKSG